MPNTFLTPEQAAQAFLEQLKARAKTISDESGIPLQDAEYWVCYRWQEENAFHHAVESEECAKFRQISEAIRAGLKPRGRRSTDSENSQRGAA